MKRSKLLIPALSLTAIAPAMVLSGCGDNKSEAEKVIDAIIAPTKIAAEVEVDDIKQSFHDMSEQEKQKEVLYDLFGQCNRTNEGNFSFDKSLTTMWQENTVSFKANIAKCSLVIDEGNNAKSSFLGYISFVFSKDVTASMTSPSIQINFKANDYIMYTYDFVDASVTINNNGSVEYAPKVAYTRMGFYKVKYNGGQDELMLDRQNPSTTNWDIKNSHRWKQKS